MSLHDFYIPPIIGEGMVLRLGKGTILWGEDIPDTKLEVEFQGQLYDTLTDKDGNWTLELHNLETGGPFELNIYGSEKYHIGQVYVGFVFLLSGQSNMELPLNRVLDWFEEEVKSINNPYIRQFAVPQEFHFSERQEKIEGGSWKSATGDNVMAFSAAGYFCAAELYEKYKIPIGLIHAAVGGSHIEAWLSKEALLPMNRYRNILKDLEKDPRGIERKKRETNREQIWYDFVEENDKGKHDYVKWYSDKLEANDWLTCHMPGDFSGLALEDFSGVIWFSHEFFLTKEDAESKEVLLRLGTLVDADETYVNGVLVGQTGYYYPPRRYRFAEGILKEGKNIIVTRIISCSGKGRFISNMPYHLKLDNNIIELSGTWYYKVGLKVEKKKPESVFFPSLPIGLYNTMIWPLRNYTVNAVLFYQGESNTNQPDYYSELFKKMIALWRSDFTQERLAFIYVQLPNYIDPLLDEVNEVEAHISRWKRFQDIQKQLLEELNDAAMIITIDTGQDNELHPQNKKDVGKRLAYAFGKLVLADEGEESMYGMESGMVKISKEK